MITLTYYKKKNVFIGWISSHITIISFKIFGPTLKNQYLLV